MLRGRLLGEPLYGARPPLDDRRPFVNQPVVPELELIRADPALAHLAQQVVALIYHPPVALDHLQIRRLALGDQDVEVPPPDRRSSRDQLDIVRRERHHVHRSNEVRRRSLHAVDAQLFPHRWRRPRPAASRLRLAGDHVEIDLGLHR